MTNPLQDLIDFTAGGTNTKSSVERLIKGILERIAASGTDASKLQVFQDQLKASSPFLADAVDACTPSAKPQPAPEPAPKPEPGLHYEPHPEPEAHKALPKSKPHPESGPLPPSAASHGHHGKRH